MVKIMENPELKADDLGGQPTIFGNIHGRVQSSTNGNKNVNIMKR